MVARLSTGEFTMSGPIGGGAILVYDSSGSFTRTIGRDGDGPGEFGATTRLAVTPLDTVYAMDDSHVRVQVLTPAGDFIRSYHYPGRIGSFTLLANGDLLAFVMPSTDTDNLFHVLSPTGSPVARFGAPTLSALDLETWVVSRGGNTDFWTASVWEYKLYHWSAFDAPDDSLVRHVDWFPPNRGFPAGTYETVPPPAFLYHMWEDSQGRLWNYILVPDPHWVPGMELRPTLEWFRKTFDTVVEVVDLEARRLVASGHYDDRYGPVCGSGLMYAVIETPEGDTRVQVLIPVVVDAKGTEVTP